MTSPDLHLRLAIADDLPAIVAIYNATIPGRTATAQLEPVSVTERRLWFLAHAPERRPLWTIEREQRILGWMGLSDFHERAAYAATAEVSVYVDDGARGQGLGGRLLDHAIAVAPAAGVTSLVGLIFAHNAPSLALFASRGFARWGLMPGVAELDGIRRDLVYVGRRVGTDGASAS